MKLFKFGQQLQYLSARVHLGGPNSNEVQILEGRAHVAYMTLCAGGRSVTWEGGGVLREHLILIVHFQREEVAPEEEG